MLLRPFPNDAGSCASYLFGCTSHSKLAVLAGSVCGRGLSGNPISSIGFERVHDPLLARADADAFADALLVDAPPPRAEQAAIVAGNRSGRIPARA